MCRISDGDILPLLPRVKTRAKERITKKTIPRSSTASMHPYRLTVITLDDMKRWKWSVTPSW